MQLFDTIALSDRRSTRDGYLVAEGRVARTGIQHYLGSEVGKPEMAVVAIYRPEEEVFSDEAFKSFAHKPITNDHPPEPVTAQNYRKYAHGHTSGRIAKDGEFVNIEMMLADAAAISEVDGGKREFSAGYTCDLDWTAGKTEAGEFYDAIQRNIRINHVALVDRGRAGSACRLGDDGKPLLDQSHPPQPADRDTPSMHKLTIDGVTVDLSDTAREVVSKVLTQLSDATTKIATLTNDHAAALATKDADLAKKDAEIDGLKAKVLDTKALDAAVQARGDLIAKAKALAPSVVTDGKTDAEIRHAVVAAKIGDVAVKDKPAVYIDTRFDILCEDVKPADPARQIIAGGLETKDARLTVDTAHAAYVNRLQDAWKGEPVKGSA